MKNFRTFKLGLLLSSFLAMPFINSAPDSVTLDTAITTGTQTMVLDRTTGDLYIGTAAAGAADLDNITKISAHTNDGTTPTQTGVASTPATNVNIRLMTPSYHPTSNVIRLAFVESTTNNHFLNIQSADGAVSSTTPALKDGNNVALLIGVASIRNIVANGTTIFAAVAASNSTNWAAANRGISVTTIANQTTLDITAATTQAVAVATTLSTDGTTHSKGAAGEFSTLTANEDPVLHWDETLSRLYIGAQLTSNALTGGNTAISVLIRNGAGGALASVGNTAALDTADVATRIVFASTTAGLASRVAKAYNLGVMHTSTGHSYLIVNGGSGAANANLRNEVYALPLVKGLGTNADGTFAKSDLTTATFNVQAVAATDIPVNTDAHAKVGTVNLPFPGTTLTRMQVIGDTVYVSSSVLAVGNGSEAGIFYSTPEFNENGKIIRWSRWAKAAPNIIGTSVTDGDVHDFKVDPRSGKVWAIVGDALSTVKVTTWGDQTGATELAGAVNAQLVTDGCTAIASFDRTTVNWGNNVSSRMALFGGKEKVVFTIVTRTSGDDDGDDIPDDPAGAYSIDEGFSGPANIGVTADFSTATNFLATTLPTGAGYVTALGGTLHTVGAKAFFFLAGTTEGLYAYANTNDGEGGRLDFDTANEHLHTLNGAATNIANAGFFSIANSWQPITSITGHIKKIKSSDAGTFILARDIGTDSTIVDTLYMLATDNDSVAELITDAKVLAQSGVSATNSDLTLATQILDFEVINGLTAGTGSQVILATNNGLYQSKTDNAIGIAFATNQAEALWTPIGEKAGNADTRGQMYTGIFAKGKTNLTTTFQAISLKDNSSNTRTYAYRDLDQFGCSDDDNLATGNSIQLFPNNFLSDSTTTFLRTHRILDYWTDGARRFMLASPSDGTGTTGLYIWPYRVGAANWNITDPVAKISASALSGKTLYCMNFLPDGHLAVGTNQGIVLL